MQHYAFLDILKKFGQEVNNVIEKAQSFPDASVVLKPSWIRQKEYLNTRYVKSLDLDRLLHNFRVNAKLPSYAKRLEGWEAP